MATKIRLQRHGRKGKAFFHIVIADSRSKRDGRFIEKIGIYNPITNPATIDLDLDRAVHWLQVGAEPSNTVRNILSYKGALMKKHLLGGVSKGAFSEEEAEKRFNAWLDERSNAVQDKRDNIAKAKSDAKSAALEAERKKSESRIATAPEETTVESEEANDEVQSQPTDETVSDVVEEATEENSSEDKEENSDVSETVSEENAEEKTEE